MTRRQLEHIAHWGEYLSRSSYPWGQSDANIFFLVQEEIKEVSRETYKKRSNQQNRYLWAYYRIISDETGNDIMDLHSYLKKKTATSEVYDRPGARNTPPRDYYEAI